MPSDNSVLVSLSELRSIERRRVDLEAEEKQRLELERRRQVEEETRAAKAMAERRRAEIEEQNRRDLVQREREAREERLRLAEAERRARVEAELALERERLAMHVGHVPAPANGGALRRVALVSFVVAAGVVIAYLGSALGHEMARRQVLVAKLDGLSERSRAAATEARRQIDLLDRQVGQLRARLAKKQSVQRDPPARPDNGHQTKRRSAAPKTRGHKPKIGEECKDSTDPICGLTGRRER